MIILVEAADLYMMQQARHQLSPHIGDPVDVLMRIGPKEVRLEGVLRYEDGEFRIEIGRQAMFIDLPLDNLESTIMKGSRLDIKWREGQPLSLLFV